MSEGKWVIAGMHGTKELFEEVELSGQVLTESDIESILQRLAARHLTEQETIYASLPGGAPGYRDDLKIQREVRKDRPSIVLSTTGNPYYMARFESD